MGKIHRSYRVTVMYQREVYLASRSSWPAVAWSCSFWCQLWMSIPTIRSYHSSTIAWIPRTIYVTLQIKCTGKLTLPLGINNCRYQSYSIRSYTIYYMNTTIRFYIIRCVYTCTSSHIQTRIASRGYNSQTINHRAKENWETNVALYASGLEPANLES